MCEFRDYLCPRDVIKSGKHFNIQLFVQAFKEYDKNFYLFGGYDSRKNNMFWCKVIAYIERYVPACYAMALLHSMHSVVMYDRKINKGINLSDAKAGYFGARHHPDFQLGFEYGIDSRSGICSKPKSAGGDYWVISDYVTKKSQYLEKYLPRYESSLMSSCSIL